MTPSLSGAYIPADPDALTSGESTIPRRNATSNVTMSTGVLRLAYFTARKSQTVASIRVICSATAAAATPTLVRFGLYTVASNGDVALVASTENDTALLATQSTAYTKAVSTPYATTAGLRYAFGILVVTGATAPTVAGNLPNGSVGSEAGIAPKIAGNVSGQTDLPASVVAASVGDNANFVYGVLLP